MNQKKLSFSHNNLFEDGPEGVLTDLGEVFALPKELYIANSFEMTFDGTGTIQTLDSFIYGKDENGEKQTYLISYDAKQDEKMTVWADGEVNASYDNDMRLEPMLILQGADYEQQVEAWSKNRGSDIYELLYYGRHSFAQLDGVRFLSGDADGDGVDQGKYSFTQLTNGGEIVGFEVSLHIPATEDITPVRYIMEPEYISQKTLDEEQAAQTAEESKDAGTWTVDRTDETMYFFLDNSRGWRLVVTGAAAGSRSYKLEKTGDGGNTWETGNTDPFEGEMGTSEGLIFFDENVGFAGITGASQSYSKLYVTRDGGKTLTRIQLPMDTVTELPEIAEECGFTIADYDYYEMPEKNGDTLIVRVETEANGDSGIVFQSDDMGETWVYAGIDL